MKDTGARTGIGTGNKITYGTMITHNFWSKTKKIPFFLSQASLLVNTPKYKIYSVLHMNEL